MSPLQWVGAAVVILALAIIVVAIFGAAERNDGRAD